MIRRSLLPLGLLLFIVAEDDSPPIKTHRFVRPQNIVHVFAWENVDRTLMYSSRKEQYTSAALLFFSMLTYEQNSISSSLVLFFLNFYLIYSLNRIQNLNNFINQ